jgi:type IV secretory pathway protease TraF
VWNATASVPTGLYAIRGKASLHVGERVAIEPPPELRRLLAERHYLPTGVPLIKRIAAVRGQRVCRFAHGITIDGQYVGAARARDRLGRPLPVWAGCHVLRIRRAVRDEPGCARQLRRPLFRRAAQADVIGRATPVWTDEAGNGDHVWFADPRATETSPTTNRRRLTHAYRNISLPPMAALPGICTR